MDSFYTSDELQSLGLKAFGENVLISRKTSIYMPENIIVGDNVRIDDYCCLVAGKKGITIGSNIHIAFHCIIIGNGGVFLEDFSGLSSRCSIYSATDDYSGKTLTNPTVPEKYKHVIEGEVHLGRHAIIGTNTTILPNVDIGEGCSVGANSLVNKNLEPWGIYFGSPAKKIKERNKDLLVVEQEYLKEKNNQS